MRVVGYVRVSTEEQSREGVSLEMQADKIRAYCSLNDLELAEIIEDRGISAKNITGRPGFQKALELVYSGHATGLVVWKLDRAFRSTKDALTVSERLNQKGRALISISERLDTSTAIGEFFFSLMASLAQMERKLIGERTAAAMQIKKAKGERVGQIPFGYRLSEDEIRLEEDQGEQAVKVLIKRLKEKGHSFRSIANELNRDGYFTKDGCAWTHVQVSRICKGFANAA